MLIVIGKCAVPRYRRPSQPADPTLISMSRLDGCSGASFVSSTKVSPFAARHLCRQAVAVWMMLLTDWMTMAGMDVPLEAPTAMDVAVVLPQPEEQSGGECRDQRDIGERPAHKVVTAVCGPVD